MPFERVMRVPEFTDAKSVLGEQPNFFTNVVVETDNSSGVEVIVEHASAGLEPVFTRGEAKKTNGESREELVFEAMRVATNTEKSVEFLGSKSHPENGVHVFLLDSYGTPVRSHGMTFEEASLQGLQAVHTMQTE